MFGNSFPIHPTKCSSNCVCGKIAELNVCQMYHSSGIYVATDVTLILQITNNKCPVVKVII